MLSLKLPFSSQHALLTSPELGLLILTHIFVLGPHAEHDELAAVCAELCPVATVVLMDLQFAEAHGCLTELTLNRALLAFLGLQGGRQDGHGLWPAATAAQLGI